MKYLTPLFCLFFTSLTVHSQVLTGNTVTSNVNDVFSYDGQDMPHYGLKWTMDSWYVGGAAAWLSGFGGFKFFTNGTPRMVIGNNGAVGIGTTTPTSALDVRGTVCTPEIAFRNADGGDDSDPYRLRKVQGSPNVNWLELQLNDDSDESFRIYGNSCVGYGCGVYSGTMYHSFNASGQAYHSGSLSIGTTDNKGYSLAVNGPAVFTKVVVKQADKWPDYVFDSSYCLPALSSVEKFVKQNKHLPEVPAATQVEKEGVDVAELQKQLLKKVEEMTLYMIAQEKKIAALQEEVEKLKAQGK